MIERRHQTLKNRILLENISCPMIHAGDHAGPNNLTPVDVTSTSAGTETIFAERECITRATIPNRRLLHQLQGTQTSNPDEPASNYPPTEAQSC
jgi:hypothetical protein